MAGETQSVIQARRDYWAHLTDDESSQKIQSQDISNGVNLASSELEFTTAATGQNGFIPVLNVMKFSSSQTKQQVKAEKSLIIIRDTSPPEREKVPSKWQQFLLEKSFTRLHRKVSSDDFIIRTFNGSKGDFTSIQRKIAMEVSVLLLYSMIYKPNRHVRFFWFNLIQKWIIVWVNSWNSQ